MPPNRDPRNPDNTCAAAVTPLINQYPAPLNQLVAIWQVRLLFLCICFPKLEFHSIDAKREVPVVRHSYRLRYVTLTIRNFCTKSRNTHSTQFQVPCKRRSFSVPPLTENHVDFHILRNMKY